MKYQYSKLHQAMFVVGAMLGGTLPTVAMSATSGDSASDANIEKIAVVGTRAAPRSVTDSPVPLDIIGAEEFVRQGNTDLKSLLSSVTPSFNVNDQPINDGSSLVRPANLRGLAADHTLVLVNGKRRHRSAVITFLGGGLSDGSQGPDISNIPVSALKQVEVLRDGAAAQYGSDAIAGVLNFVLKDAPQGGSVETRYGQFYEGDGAGWQFSGNKGFALSENGFANFSMEYRTQDSTSRSVQRDDAAGLAAAGNPFIIDPAQVWGTPEVKSDVKILGNFGLDLNDTDKAYMWINYAKRDIDGGFYYRNPHNRGGVNDGGMKPTGQIGSDGKPILAPTLLVGDLTPNDGIACPVVFTGSNVLNSDAYKQVAADPNCFAFNEIFPGGFTPRFGGKINDLAFALGTEGQWQGDWNYDLSASYGYSDVEYSIYNTINPSLGPASPTSFKPGAYTQLEQTYNFDVTKQLLVDGWEEPINFASGLEYRYETFEIQNGDPASFEVGPLANQGFGIGSNGFPGFKPQDSGSWSRSNIAAYVDMEFYATPDWLLTGAVRYEDFSDFGSTVNGKVSTHYSISEVWAIRSAASTGFRAPTVGQSNVRNVTTAFTANGLEDQATLPPTHPISIQKGGEPLEPETSVNLSLGAVAEFENGLYMTVDYFNIKLKDRISQTSPLELTLDDIDDLLALGVNDATSFSSVKYFTNDFDTTTQGVDVVMNYNMEILGGDTKFQLAYNWTDTQVDSYNPANINAAKVQMLEDNLPAQRANFTTIYEYGDVNTLMRVNYYGDYYEDHLDAGGDLPIYAGSEVTVDLEMSYFWNEAFSTSVGANNLFDNSPDENPWSGVVGALYPSTSPMGINGGFYYVRANYMF